MDNDDSLISNNQLEDKNIIIRNNNKIFIAAIAVLLLIVFVLFIVILYLNFRISKLNTIADNNTTNKQELNTQKKGIDKEEKINDNDTEIEDNIEDNEVKDDIELDYPEKLENYFKSDSVFAKLCQKENQTEEYSNYFLNPTDFPINLSFLEEQEEYQVNQRLSCGHEGFFYLTLNQNNNKIYVFDQYSEEGGHGGLSFFKKTGAFFKEDGDIEYTLSIPRNDGLQLYTTDTVSVNLRATKKIITKDGQEIFIKTEAVFIEANDPDLISSLTKYTDPDALNSLKEASSDDFGLDQIDPNTVLNWEDLNIIEEKLAEEFKNTTNEDQTEKIAELKNILSSFTLK
ncbi:hypothetical protein GYA19_04140 [Candidatus Beckwithbacteria bacterium]|nr:hypothetical protein [Candidatus Beckwithbacteria bacterium]